VAVICSGVVGQDGAICFVVRNGVLVGVLPSSGLGCPSGCNLCPSRFQRLCSVSRSCSLCSGSSCRATPRNLAVQLKLHVWSISAAKSIASPYSSVQVRSRPSRHAPGPPGTACRLHYAAVPLNTFHVTRHSLHQNVHALEGVVHHPTFDG
jgi:hypothetical protein